MDSGGFQVMDLVDSELWILVDSKLWILVDFKLWILHAVLKEVVMLIWNEDEM
jgi:hypothetical protein